MHYEQSIRVEGCISTKACTGVLYISDYEWTSTAEILYHGATIISPAMSRNGVRLLWSLESGKTIYYVQDSFPLSTQL